MFYKMFPMDQLQTYWEGYRMEVPGNCYSEQGEKQDVYKVFFKLQVWGTISSLHHIII